MLNYTLILVFNWKTGVQMSGHLTSQCLFIHEYKNARLRLHRKRRQEEAFVILHVLDAVDDLMSCVNCVGAIRSGKDVLITQLQELLLNCFAYMRWECS
jgi:hypothetical protein